MIKLIVFTIHLNGRLPRAPSSSRTVQQYTLHVDTNESHFSYLSLNAAVLFLSFKFDFYFDRLFLGWLNSDEICTATICKVGQNLEIMKLKSVKLYIITGRS